MPIPKVLTETFKTDQKKKNDSGTRKPSEGVCKRSPSNIVSLSEEKELNGIINLPHWQWGACEEG